MQKSLHLCYVCLHQWRVPKFALKYPCNPPPPPGGDRHLVTVTWRPSRARGGYFKGGVRIVLQLVGRIHAGLMGPPALQHWTQAVLYGTLPAFVECPLCSL